MAYKHYLKPKNTMSGVADYVLVAPREAFTTVSDPTDNSSQITAAHVFADAANGGFIKLQGVPNKNQYANNASGDKGLMRQKATATAFIPGSDVDLHNTMRELINQPLIVLQKDGNCGSGEYYQVGSSCKSAYLEASDFTTGTDDEGNKGYMVTFTAAHPVITYKPAAEPKLLTEVVIP